MIGAPDDWFPWLDGRNDIREVGLVELAPLLVTEPELPLLIAERPAHPSAPPGAAAAAGGGQLNLDDVVLESTPHPRRGLRLTLLELVAWLAHERHSDAPRTVSPVLAAHARWFASALDGGRRQQLKELARALIGTRSPSAVGHDGLAPEDTARAWLATDWLLRAQAPAWLHAASLHEAAGRLEDLGPTDDPGELRRAIDIVAEVLVHPERGDPTGGHAADRTLAPRLVWDSWETASEQGGWVAASEAAGFGVPPDLAYAVELCVIECARDRRVRDGLTNDGRSMVDAARAAGWSAVAHQAWSAGLRAAEAAVDERSRVPWASAYDRSRRAVIERTGIDADQFQASADAGERAAHEAMASAGRRRATADDDGTVWDSVLQAARRDPAAAAWADALDLARDAVEPDPWDEGRLRRPPRPRPSSATPPRWWSEQWAPHSLARWPASRPGSWPSRWPPRCCPRGGRSRHGCRDRRCPRAHHRRPAGRIARPPRGNDRCRAARRCRRARRPTRRPVRVRYSCAL